VAIAIMLKGAFPTLDAFSASFGLSSGCLIQHFEASWPTLPHSAHFGRFFDGDFDFVRSDLPNPVPFEVLLIFIASFSSSPYFAFFALPP